MTLRILLLGAATIIACEPALSQDRDGDPAATQRRMKAQEFYTRVQQRTGVLVPLYVYPSDVHKNAEYNRLIELKLHHGTVPIWVILNPDSGPGKQVDLNYTKVIDRLQGAGCMVLGYVTTSYGKRTSVDV